MRKAGTGSVPGAFPAALAAVKTGTGPCAPLRWPRSQSPFSPALVRYLAALVLLAGILGAGPIEVREVRVPASKVTSYFPAGTPLRIMSEADYRDLLDRAREGVEARKASESPSLVGAHHEARWEGGVLRGRSEFSARNPGLAPSFLPLEPWSPAVRDADRADRVRSLSDGRSALWIDQPGESRASLHWMVNGRPGSRGRVFDVSLPAVVVSRLELDLPRDLKPEILQAVLVGSRPSSESGRVIWSFDGASGALTVQLRPMDATRTGPSSVSAWISGPTRIEVLDASASFEADWTVELAPGRSRTLGFELDPGLQFVRLDGSDVVSVRTEPDGEATRIFADLGASVENTTHIRLLAMGRVPDEGRWKVPAARPLGAAWTGGRTVLWIGPNRVVKDQTPRSGWLVPARNSEQELSARGGHLLVYESLAPRSVAEVLLVSPSAGGSVSIRGSVNMDQGAPSLEVTLTWKLDHGPLLALPIDLPAGWTPDSVQVLGLDEPTSWRLEQRPGSEPRIVVQPPPYLDPDAALTVRLTAEADGPISQTLRVPRVRPALGRVADDLWFATGSTGSSLIPTRARGLCWVDPGTAANPGETPETESPRLSWRWTDPDGLLELHRRPDPGTVSGECWAYVQVHTDRMEWDWYVWIRSVRSGVSSILLKSPLTLDELPEWFVLGDESGLPREVEPVDEEHRQGLALRENETAFRVSLPQGLAPGDPVVLHARFPVRPTGDARIPLVSLPSVEHARGCVLVTVEDPLLANMTAEGLIATDRVSAQAAFASHFNDLLNLSPDRSSTLRPAQAFDYGPKGGTLDLHCTRLDLVDSDGYLSEMILSSVYEGHSDRLRRLLVRLPAWRSRPLSVRMPAGSTLERSVLNGRSVVPREHEGQLCFEFPAGPTDAPQHELVLDYREPLLKTPPHPGEVSIVWPRFSLPCLSSSVILDTPPSIRIATSDETFESTEPGGQAGSPSLDLRDWQRTPASEADPGALRALEERDPMVGPWAMTLGERLIQLDRVETPLVIDRQALEDAGIGPRSRPGGMEPASRSLDGFRNLGLVLVPVGRILLVSTPAARPDLPGGPLSQRATRAAWISALETAVARGSDPTDRFQSVTRWRGAATPDARPLERPGATHQRWLKVGPPPLRFTCDTTSRMSQFAGTVSLSAAVFALGVWPARRSRAPRLVLLGVTLGLAMLAALLGHSGLEGWPTGLVLGWVATLAFWVGQALRSASRPRPDSAVPRSSSSSSAARAIPSGSASVLLLGLGLVLPASSLLAFQDGTPAREPILVLIPYDQTPDPSESGPRFVLRLTDFEALQALARSSTPPPPAIDLSATDVKHRISLRGEDQVEFTSEYRLIHSGSTPTPWTIPLGLGRDLAASLDGTPVPVRVEAEGRQASVLVEGHGPHQLVLSQRIELVSRDTLHAPVVPSAIAVLEVQGQTPGRRVEVNGTVGPVESSRDHTLAYLGSVAAVDLRWVDLDRDPEGQLGTVDGLLLWTVQPSGDRIEARLSFRSTEPRTELRLALEPGLEVRSASFAGWKDASWEGTPENPIWVAPATPPLPDGSVVVLEFWRPTPVSNPTERGSRPAPRIEVLDVGASSGILAVQLVPGWSASFEPQAGHDPLLEDIFLRSWSVDGHSPPEVETALTWVPRPALRVQAGPSPPRLSIRPSVRLEIERGRVMFQGELACQGAKSPISEVEVRIPPSLQVVSVDSARLSDWSRPAKDRLRLRFETLDTLDRTILVSGWIAVETDPLAAENRLRVLPVPWISVEDATQEAGSLLVQYPPGLRPALRDFAGLTPTPSTSPLVSVSDRLLFRSVGPPPTGQLVWNEDGSRASVSLLSHLLFRPGRVDWTCLVRYRSLGGPTRSIRMTLPASWGSSLQVESLQGAADTQLSTDGPRTTLDITLETPIWGEQELILRAHRPFEGDRMVFPDLVPLGNGQVKTSIAWTNLSGRSLAAEGSAGIQPVEPSRFAAAGLPIPSSADLRVYQVLRSGWSLAIQAPSGHVASGGDSDFRAVSFEDVECVLASDGWITGRCRFLVESGSAPFLSLTMPERARPLSVLVNGASVRPLKDPDGRLLIPLGDASAPVVLLLWDQPSDPSGPVSDRLALPAPATGQTPLALMVHAPPDKVLEPPPALRRDVGLAVEVDRYEYASTRLIQSLADFDRSSIHDRSQLLASLVALELRVRSALRLARAPMSGQEAWSIELRRALLNRISQASSGLQDTLRAAGLDEYLTAARHRVGLEPPDPRSDRSEMAEPPSEFRLLRLGQPSWYRGAINATDGEVALSIDRTTARPSRFRPGMVLAFAGLLVWSALLTWLSSSTSRRPWALLMLTALGLVSTWPLELDPLAYALVFAFLALGALVRPPREAQPAVS